MSSKDSWRDVRPWRWLFPATYVVHIAEELWAGEGFPCWISTIADTTPATATQFLVWNLVGLMLMIVATLWARNSVGDWLLTILGATVGINGIAHVLASAATGTYAPGTVSGLLIWIPLGTVTLRWAWQDHRRIFWRSLAIGAAINGAVGFLSMNLGRIG